MKYTENRSFGCGKTVADLEAVTKTADDPTRVFHQTQTCIARKSCDLRCRMDHCKWMDRVIPDFVNPYLQKAGDWPEIEQRCGAMARMGAPFNGLLCASLMAQYHIEKDLTAALTLHGCGSENDWNLVFSTIQACPSSGGKVAEVAVRDLREQARATCLVRRQTAPDPLIEIPLKGKTCDQQQ
ncbi:hypothetical protein FBR04_09870 [Betaproteobacteria bacterium PRO7]|nr:hypothetical protein [Betaproteobacteria bacterium PRO7]